MRTRETKSVKSDSSGDTVAIKVYTSSLSSIASLYVGYRVEEGSLLLSRRYDPPCQRQSRGHLDVSLESGCLTH